ncbi:ROK family transcriptional regulator [Nanchangia anserum]|uniref:ROK family transcriptional regulator n=2 Tax=Nanchangia anserum TaxID=2692125 RepID=A0A8I0KUC8_9ACTO|nr:ROK family transcriptional regulator [Nanchangia anserum]QOX82661.1 ROK family transcriptional regulator [Nanchangia anserum]
MPRPSSVLVPRSRASVTGSAVRATNAAAVLHAILAADDGISRARIATAVGSTKATVSKFVDDFARAGLVSETPAPASGRGRPGIAVRARPGAVLALGLEINVNSLRARVIDLAGTVIAEDIAPTPVTRRPADALAALADLAQTTRERALARACTDLGTGAPVPRYLGCGLALPGLISPTEVAIAPNLGWRHIPLAEITAPLEALGPALIANEADLAAYALAHPRPGVAAETESFIYVSGEVGIGAGLVLSHAPVDGAHGWSGEIGHICVNPEGPRCGCGATGCLESYLGLRALAAAAGLAPDAHAEDIDAAAHRGSQQARRALTEGGKALGRALAAVINILDIPAAILGGNIAELASWLVPPARAELYRRVPHAEWSTPQLRVRTHSANLAATGAAHRVLQRLVDDPLAELADPA